MAHPNRPTWTDAENEVLRQHYATADAATLASLLPRRNAHGIKMQAGRLKLARAQPSPGTWSEEHMAILREHYPTKGSAYVAALVGRSRNRVTGHAHEHLIPYIGVRNPKRPKPAGPTYPEKKAVGRPRKVQEVAPVPVPKRERAAKPVAVAPEPVKRSPATPTLNTRAEQRRLQEAIEAKKPKRFVTADEIRELRADHPARWAYTRAARQGPEAATAAFRQAMSQLNQAA